MKEKKYKTILHLRFILYSVNGKDIGIHYIHVHYCNSPLYVYIQTEIFLDGAFALG